MFNDLDSIKISPWEKVWLKFTGKDKWMPAIGTIRGVAELDDEGGTMYLLTYTYSVDGEIYSATFKDGVIWDRGDEIDIRYDPRKPSQCYWPGKPSRFWMFLFIAAFGLGAFILRSILNF